MTEPQPEKSDLDWKMDRLLAWWHNYRRNAMPVRGFERSDLSCRNYRAGTHWDWQNGAADDRAEREQLKGFERLIDKIPDEPQRWRLALHYEAWRLASTAQVFTLYRLPQDREELELLVLEARNKLGRLMISEGMA